MYIVDMSKKDYVYVIEETTNEQFKMSKNETKESIIRFLGSKNIKQFVEGE